MEGHCVYDNIEDEVSGLITTAIDRMSRKSRSYSLDNGDAKGGSFGEKPNYATNTKQNRQSLGNYVPNDYHSDAAYDNPSFKSLNDHANNDKVPNVAINIPDFEQNHGKESDFISEMANVTIKAIMKYISLIKLIAFGLYNGYLGSAIYLTWNKTKSYCDGIKLLVILTGIAYFIVLYNRVLKRFVVKPFHTQIINPIIKSDSKAFEKSKRFIPIIIWAILMATAAGFVIFDAVSKNEKIRMISGAGLIGLIILGFFFSKHRSRIIWNQVLWGVGLQFVFGLITLRWSFGKSIFECLGDKVSTFLGFTDEGTTFVFGYLITGKLNSTGLTETLPIQASIFAFKVLPVIMFFSFFVSILYYYGVMQILVVKVGWFLQKTVGTTACESLNASSNIFLGMTEAPLMIKPFLPVMTKSELHAVMTGGFATIAGAVMAAYMSFGVSASHLLSASVMSAPAALAYSKLLYPETEISKTTSKNIVLPKGTERNALEAAANGASVSIKLCANIAANLIAFIAFIKFLDSLISWFGSLIDLGFVDFRWILSKLFIPIALMMGVEWDESDKVAQLVGLKTVINEFVAYQELGNMIKGNSLSKRAEVIATYALCGFSNFSSIGIQLGGLGAMAPERKSDLASIALRAMIAGCAACFMTACIAGMLIHTEAQQIATPTPNITFSSMS